MKKIFLEIVLWTWCLLGMLGVVYYIVYRNKIIKKKEYKGISVYHVDTDLFGGVSAGKFIFIGKNHFNERTIRHEYGHTIQTYIFGPLTLIVIALPSAIMFWISKFNKNFKKNYFKRFPENWADRLGGVGR